MNRVRCWAVVRSGGVRAMAALVACAVGGAVWSADARPPSSPASPLAPPQHRVPPGRPMPGRGGETRAPATPVKTVVIEVGGDLDCVQVARDLGRELRAARNEDAGMVVLEMGGNRWRGEVVLAMAREMEAYWKSGLIAGMRPRVVVVLNDPADKRVGTGQAALGVVAEASVLGPGVTIGLADGEDLMALSTGMKEEDADRELRSIVYASQLVRGADELVHVLLPRASQPIWVLMTPGEGRGAKLVADPAKGPPGAQRVAQREGSGESAWTELDAETARKLGIVTSVGVSPGPVYAELNIRPVVSRRATVTSGLAAARMRVRQGLREQEGARAGLDAELDRAEKLRGDDAPARKRAAGAAVEPGIERAIKELEEVEALTKEFPELLVEFPPGVTSVEQPAAKVGALWRDVFQEGRDKLAALRERARRLASEVK